MPSVIFRGRIAWIMAMVFGLILVVVGAVMKPPETWLIVVGSAFAGFGLLFLILSYASRGRTD